MRFSNPTIRIVALLSLSSASIAPSSAAAATAAAVEKKEEDTGKPGVAHIIRGTPTGGPLPYQVDLSSSQTDSICGGSLIAPRVVLTAAHCYYNDPDGNFKDPPLNTAKVNMYHFNKPAGVISNHLAYAEEGRDIFIHPNFTGSSQQGNDIALVILPVGLEEGEKIVYAKLNRDPNVPAAGERLYASGWGIKEDGSQSDRLLGTVLEYVPNDKCFQSDWPYSTDGQMCAYMEVEGKSTGTCHGDSGGPIVIASQNEIAPATIPPLQVGITSWGDGCGQKGKADYYTRVSSYIDWIEETACAKVGELCSSSKSGKSSRSGCGNSKASKSQVLPSVSAEEDVAAVHDEMNV